MSYITSYTLVPYAGCFSQGVARMNSFLEVLEVQGALLGQLPSAMREEGCCTGLASGLQVQETTLISVNLREKKNFFFFFAEIAV